MSDDPKGMVDLASAHGGWIAAFLLGTWGIILRALVGRHLRREEKHQDWVKAVDKHLLKIDGRLEVIESRSHNRRREDRRHDGDDRA